MEFEPIQGRGVPGHAARISASRVKKAIATFQHYCLQWEKADTLQYWGRALLAAGEHPHAIEKFDGAIEIYPRRGAGMRFIQYVIAYKIRAQSYKSTRGEA